MIKQPLILLVVPLCCLTLPVESHANITSLIAFSSIYTANSQSAIGNQSPQEIAQTAKTYRTKLGDTLSGIAVKFGLSTAQILNYNPSLKSNPNLLQIGQIINLTPTSSLVSTGKKLPQNQTRNPPIQPRQSAFSNLNIPKIRRQGSRVIAAKRGLQSCLKNSNQSLKILLPETNFGYTLQDYPTFFWYVPQLIEPNTSQFSLRSVENDTVIYKTIINDPTPETIASFSLPSDAPALKEGKEYEWEIRIICNNDSLITTGRIQRLITDNPALVQKLEKATIQDYPAIFAQAGIWYDAIATLAALRRENPQDKSLTQDWEAILKMIGYQDLTNVPEKPVMVTNK